MTFTATGDMAVQRRIHKDSPEFAEVSAYLRQGDARFVKLENIPFAPEEMYAYQE